MDKKSAIFIIIAGLVVLALVIFGIWYIHSTSNHSGNNPGANSEIPYYLVTIHVNPPTPPKGGDSKVLSDAYSNLKTEVDYADRYNIKLSIWLGTPISQYIIDSNKISEVRGWMQQGHEIGLHHHSAFRPTEWDGYSSLSKEDAEAVRMRLNGKVEPWGYLGNLQDMMSIIKQINPDVKSGVCSESYNFSEALPDEIVYLTGSNFLNNGVPGRINPESAQNILSAQNDFISTGFVNGIERKWLTHFDIGTRETALNAEAKFSSMNSGVFSVITHNDPDKIVPLEKFLDYIHSKDPNAGKSRTISEVIDQGLIPEKKLPEGVLN